MAPSVIQKLLDAVERAVVGRRVEIETIFAAWLADGHVLIEGTPGTAKTLLVRALSAATQCTYRRIQFTPDLMPSDVTGLNMYDAQKSVFRLVRGPVFSDMVLADEVNRAPAKTQAALLECMEERSVTIDGETHGLPAPFTVFATMNPIDFEGTFALPEAQLDRFMVKVRMRDIDAAAEQEVMSRFCAGFDPWALADMPQVMTSQQLVSLRQEVRKITVEARVQHYLVDIIRRTRVHPAVAFGASTRAAVALMRASRARAMCEGRDYVIPDDIKFLAPAVLGHRMVMRPEAQLEELTTHAVLKDILNDAPVPRG